MFNLKKIQDLLLPVSDKDGVAVFREVMLHFRNDLLSIESAFLSPEEGGAKQQKMRLLGTLERYAIELWHYLKQGYAALDVEGKENAVFNPRKALRPLQGIFEFKALQKDLMFNLVINETVPEQIYGSETILKSLLSTFLTFLVQEMNKGDALTCEIMPLVDQSEGISCKFSFEKRADQDNSDQAFSPLRHCTQDLLSYLIRAQLSASGALLKVDEALMTCDLELPFLRESSEAGVIEEKENATALEPEFDEKLSEIKENSIKENKEITVIGIEEEQVELAQGERFESFFSEHEHEDEQKIWLGEEDEIIEIASELEAKEVEAELGRRLRIIVADDNQLVQRFLSRIVEAEGHAVSCESNGKELLSRLDREQFDACILDCQTRVIDGYKATGLIRAHEARSGRRMKIIGMATDLDVDTEERCFQAGMDAYLTKPVHKGKLLSLLTGYSRKDPAAE